MHLGGDKTSTAPCDHALSDIRAIRWNAISVIRKAFIPAIGGRDAERFEIPAIAAIEAQVLSYGYRFEPSAISSARERPDAYKDSGLYQADFSFEHPDAPTAPTDDVGRELRGAGDNVVTRERNLTGIARYVRTSEKVLEYLTHGVPADTIAIVDDSGGTLTAPILEKFSGVLCAGGTTRSHLAILTREYGIPCLMNARLSGIRDGERLEVESTARAKTGEDYAQGIDASARVWRLA